MIPIRESRKLTTERTYVWFILFLCFVSHSPPSISFISFYFTYINLFYIDHFCYFTLFYYFYYFYYFILDYMVNLNINSSSFPFWVFLWYMHIFGFLVLNVRIFCSFLLRNCCLLLSFTYQFSKRIIIVTKLINSRYMQG